MSLPLEALYVIRYHSLYPWHTYGHYEELESDLKILWPTYPNDWRYQDDQLVDLRWQIEEFRVLCFAQSLKTRDKVSYKRLSTALREYRQL